VGNEAALPSYGGCGTGVSVVVLIGLRRICSAADFSILLKSVGCAPFVAHRRQIFTTPGSVHWLEVWNKFKTQAGPPFPLFPENVGRGWMIATWKNTPLTLTVLWK
jgi:hypothetical protein